MPTVWLLLLQHLEKTGSKLPYLERVVIGGSACPRAMIKTFEEDYGVEVFHAWGMTEMSPLGTVGSIKPQLGHLDGDALLDVKQKQGYTPFGVEMKITDDADKSCRGTARPSAASRCAALRWLAAISRKTTTRSTIRLFRYRRRRHHGS